MSLTSLVFVLLFTAGLVASLVRHPAFGLYTYIAVFYLHPPDRWWGQALPDLRWSLLAAFVTLLSLWRLERIADRPGWLQSNPVRIFLLFVVWFWLQLPWALDTALHIDGAVLFTKYILLVFMIYSVVQTEEIFRNVLLTHVLGCFYLGWLIFVSPDSGRADGRFDGVGGPGIDDANSLSTQLATGLLAASALVVNASMRVRVMAMVATPFIVNGMIQTLSRGPVLGLIAGGLAMLLVTPVRFKRVYIGLGVLGVLILVRVAPLTFWERLGTISAPMEQSAQVDMSTQTRLALVTAQLEMATDYPFGAGHRGTAVLSPRYLGQEYMANDATGAAIGTRSSHNTLLTVLVEQGIPGAIIYLCLAVAIFRQIVRLKRLDSEGLPEALGTYRATIAGVFVCVTIAGLFTDYLKLEISIWFIGLLAALATVAKSSLPTVIPEPSPAPRPESKAQPGRVRHPSTARTRR